MPYPAMSAWWLGLVGIRQQPAVDLRMKGDDSMIEDCRHAGEVGEVGDGRSRGGIALAVPPLLTIPAEVDAAPRRARRCLSCRTRRAAQWACPTVGDHRYPHRSLYKVYGPRGLECDYLEAHVDLEYVQKSDWMKIGGAVGFFIFGFFKWVTVEGPAGLGSAHGGNVFDFFWTGTLPWIIIIATGVITFLLANGT